MSNIQLILLGVSLGLLLFISPGGFLLILIVALVVSWLYKKDVRDIKFILALFLSAFIVRVLLLLIPNAVLILSGKVLSYPGYPGWAPNLIGDSAYYTLRGYWMALDWKGFDLSDRVLKSAYNPIYGWHGYTYIIAFFNYFFGFSPISSKIVNCIFGSLNAVLAFLIMRESYTEKIAGLAGIFVAFLPSLLLWSVTNLKDSSIILVTLFILWSFIMFNRRKNKFVFFIFIVAGLIAQSTLRENIAPLTIGALLISYIIVMPKPKFLIKLLIGILFVIVLLLSGKLNFRQIDTSVRGQIRHALAIHQAAFIGEGSNYRILDDKYYIINKNFKPHKDPDSHWYLYHVEDFNYLQYFQTLTRGWIHFLFEPFPWKIDTKLKLLSYPQMVVWYILAPFAFLGLLILLRYRWREYLVLFVYFAVMTSGCALTLTNIGTVFRLRDMVSPIFLMFAALGIGKLARWRILKVPNVSEKLT